MLDRPGCMVIYHQIGIYCQRHLAFQKMLILGFAGSGGYWSGYYFSYSLIFQTLHGWQMLLCHNFLSQTILTLIICMCNLLTFFWQTSSLSTSWLPVQQLTLWAGGGHWGCPDCIPIITEGVPSAWIPGGGLPQPSLGLGLQTGFLDVVADGWRQPVPIDLI